MASDLSTRAIAEDLVRQHVDRACRLLTEHDADGLFVFRDTNILAFCGVPLGPSDRLICGLLGRGGEVALVVPAFEATLAEGRPDGTEVITWEEHEDPYAAVARATRHLGLESGTILLDGHTWMAAAERLARALPAATLRPDPGVIEAVRAVKTEAEIAAIRAACGDAGKIYPMVAERLRVGVSEIELSQDVLKGLQCEGVKPVGDLIQGGQTASVPHRQAGQRRLQSGDAVIVDFVCERDGYLADLTRTLSLGRPGDEIRRAYGLVRDAQRRAIETVRPGVSCEAVDRAARSVIEAAGLGAYFVHRVGHGIGLDVHEAPFLVQGNQQPLAPGMCVTIEPGVYLPGRFGIRIEDVVAVTENGCEILSDKVPTDISPALG